MQRVQNTHVDAMQKGLLQRWTRLVVMMDLAADDVSLLLVSTVKMFNLTESPQDHQ